MKHIVVVSKRVPKEAAAWQEAVCQSAQIMVALLEVKSGSVPGLTYINTKCDLPTPNTPGTGTGT